MKLYKYYFGESVDNMIKLHEEASDISLRNISVRNDKENIKKIFDISFNDHGFDSEYIEHYFNDPYSIWKIAEYKGSCAGFYLLYNQGIPEVKCVPENQEFYESLFELTGVEGVALCILPEYKSLGFGTILKDWAETLGFDYIWGMQLDSLNNLDNWLRRRKLIYRGDINITAEKF